MTGLAVLFGALLLAGAVYDTAHMLAAGVRRAAREVAERRLVALRLHGRIDAATYRHRMAALARGHRTSPTRPERPERRT
ncbi:hypothetical protein SMIR_41000 (plasmid) [Streptomyces mirabilis]|uniref:hypothetical protein n=1 Tax=Streptomyces mirabilis TaxID=68239 RepID=UPI001BAFAAB5|nr:hypothetical protein [Streptomyces mirabilis]QUW85459.1 hypothetical protein SMIR_41000 [Streptomyces mirabilis]